MRKLMFTLAAVNAVLNMLVIGIFMPTKVIVLYDFYGQAAVHGSRWAYLIFVAIPVIISGTLFLFQKKKKDSSPDLIPHDSAKKETDEDDDEDTSDVIDDILSGNTLHSDNIGMICTWFFAVISWVMTGIALNSIEYIGVILPSIIVIMLSAGMIFVTGIYSNASASMVCGMKLKWLENNEAVSKRASRFSTYMGTLSGMLGVCLSAWSLVVSNNFPNCLAVLELVVVAFIMPVLYSYFLSVKSNNKTGNSNENR